MTFSDQAKLNDENASLHSKQTNWEQFRLEVSQSLALNIPLKKHIEVDETIQMQHGIVHQLQTLGMFQILYLQKSQNLKKTNEGFVQRSTAK